jgi:hypothetical protein
MLKALKHQVSRHNGIRGDHIQQTRVSRVIYTTPGVILELLVNFLQCFDFWNGDLLHFLSWGAPGVQNLK